MPNRYVTPQQLPPIDGEGLIHVIVDTPKGSQNKIKFDEDLQCFRLSRILPVGMSFPCNFGFIPGTRADDGDALDVAILMDAPLPPGSLVTVRLLGVLRASQRQGRKSERNDRLLAVPVTPVNTPPEEDLKDIHSSLLAQIEHFFVSYNAAQGRAFEVSSRKGAAAAAATLKRGIARYDKERR